MNYLAYTNTVLEQTRVHRELLNTLAGRKDLSLIERAATERSLQVIIEALIGCSKHLNRKLNLPARTEAFSNFQQLADNRIIRAQLLPELRGAIGMRNAIVHDYLNLDWRIIGEVLDQKKYLILVEIIEKICQRLNQ